MTDAGALADRLAELAHARVLIIGDAMLDRFVYGTVERISPEAPIPVMRVERQHKAGRVRRAAMVDRRHAEAALVAVQPRQTLFGHGKPGVPHERAVAEHPERVHGDLWRFFHPALNTARKDKGKGRWAG